MSSSQNVLSIERLWRGDSDEANRAEQQNRQWQMIDESEGVVRSTASPISLALLPPDVTAILKYVPFDRQTLSATRCVSKSWRYTIESDASLTFGASGEMFHSKHGQQTVFNQRRTADGVGNDDRGNVGAGSSSELVTVAATRRQRKLVDRSFALFSVNPAGRKFRDHTAKILSRNFDFVSVGLTKLQLHNAYITNDVFHHLRPIETLRDLQLVHCRDITSLSGVNELPGLESLEVELCRLEPNGAAGLFLPHLKRLAIRKCSQLESLLDIAPETAVGLVEFSCEECPMIADDTAIPFFQQLHNIEVLNCSSTALERAISEIPQSGLTSLKTIDVSCTGTTGEVLEMVAQNNGQPNATVTLLRCSMCEGFLNATSLRQYAALTVLDISCNDLTHHEAIGSGLSAQHLVSLRIAETDTLTDVHWISACPKLRIVDLSATAIGNSSILHLGRLEELEMLILTSCQSVTSLNAIAGCPTIKYLFAAGTSVDDNGIYSLSRCLRLEELDLSSTEVTSVAHLASLPALRMLSVYRAVDAKDELRLFLDRGPDFELVTDALSGASFSGA